MIVAKSSLKCSSNVLRHLSSFAGSWLLHQRSLRKLHTELCYGLGAKCVLKKRIKTSLKDLSIALNSWHRLY